MLLLYAESLKKVMSIKVLSSPLLPTSHCSPHVKQCHGSSQLHSSNDHATTNNDNSDDGGDTTTHAVPVAFTRGNFQHQPAPAHQSTPRHDTVAVNAINDDDNANNNADKQAPRMQMPAAISNSNSLPTNLATYLMTTAITPMIMLPAINTMMTTTKMSMA